MTKVASVVRNVGFIEILERTTLFDHLVEYPKLQLFERCNASIGQSNNADQMLQCDANCLRAFCTPGYRTENDQCGTSEKNLFEQ